MNGNTLRSAATDLHSAAKATIEAFAITGAAAQHKLLADALEQLTHAVRKAEGRE